MGTYAYRITTKTVKTTDGREANVMECLGKPPAFSSSDKAHSNWDRKIGTAYRRYSKMEAEGKITGRFVEDTQPGSPVYEGTRACYFDTHYYSTIDKIEVA